MVDSKYGIYKIIVWLPLMSVFYFYQRMTSGWRLFLAILPIAILIVVGLTKFEKKHPFYNEENRQQTTKHFRGLCVFILIIVYLVVGSPISVNSNDIFEIFFLFLVALSDIVPSFFTRLNAN